MVNLGQTLTLWCHSGPPFVIFRLLKGVGTSFPELQGHHFNTFTLGPVTREHARSYTCSEFYRSLPVQSDISDPLQIVVTGRRGPAQLWTPVPAGNPTLGPNASAAKDVLRIPSQDRTTEREQTLRV